MTRSGLRFALWVCLAWGAGACATSEDDPPRKVPGGFTDATTETGTGGGSTGGTGGSAGDGGVQDAAFDAPEDAPEDTLTESDAESGPATRLLLAARVAGGMALAERGPAASWSTQLSGVTSQSNPALAAGASGAVLVMRGPGVGELLEARWTAPGVWSQFDTVGTDGFTVGSPSLDGNGDVVLGFIGTDFKLYAARSSAGGAFSPFEPVVGGAVHSFGPSAPTIALGSQTTLAFAGDDGKLYTQTKTTAWQPAYGHTLPFPLDKAIPPRIVARSGTSGEFVVAYVEDASKFVRWTQGQDDTWTAPALVGTSLTSLSNVALAPLDGGAVALAFVAGDSRLRTARIASGVLSMLESPFPTTTVSGDPALSRGLDGDLEIAFVSNGAALAATRTSSWQAPVTVIASGAEAVSLTRATASSP